MKIIGFIGLPGSGKGEASQIARELGLTVLVMGDIIRQEASRIGLQPTDKNLGHVGRELRAREGPDAVARRIFEKAMASGEEIVVIDGLRSGEEADYFRGHAEEFHLVEICAPAETRLLWLTARGRPDDPGKEKADAGHNDDGEAERKFEANADHNDEADEKIIVSCKGLDRRAAEALEERECRELGWGMCEAIKAAELKIRNDGSLEEFRNNVTKLLVLLAGKATATERSATV